MWSCFGRRFFCCKNNKRWLLIKFQNGANVQAKNIILLKKVLASSFNSKYQKILTFPPSGKDRGIKLNIFHVFSEGDVFWSLLKVRTRRCFCKETKKRFVILFFYDLKALFLHLANKTNNKKVIYICDLILSADKKGYSKPIAREKNVLKRFFRDLLKNFYFSIFI